MAKTRSIKPDNSYTEENGVFTFTAWGLSVAAEKLKEAKQHALDFHLVDVDKDVPPSTEDVKELTEKPEKQ